jgi:hypothetical protein
MQLLKFQYTFLFFSSCISVIYPQPSILNPKPILVADDMGIINHPESDHQNSFNGIFVDCNKLILDLTRQTL